MTVARSFEIRGAALLASALLFAPASGHAGEALPSCNSPRALALVRTFAAEIPDLRSRHQVVRAIVPRSTLMANDSGIRCAAIFELSDGTRRDATYSFEVSSGDPRLFIALNEATTRL